MIEKKKKPAALAAVMRTKPAPAKKAAAAKPAPVKSVFGLKGLPAQLVIGPKGFLALQRDALKRTRAKFKAIKLARAKKA